MQVACSQEEAERTRAVLRLERRQRIRRRKFFFVSSVIERLVAVMCRRKEMMRVCYVANCTCCGYSQVLVTSFVLLEA